MKRIIVSVINDLSTDQRVHKTCITLKNSGFDVLLVGQQQANSLPLLPRSYATMRLPIFFKKGPWFYFEYNVKLFWFLLFNKTHVLLANDLDTLLPNYLIAKFKRTNLVYDTHEIFCEVPELQGRPMKKNIWLALEKYIFPKLKDVFTVNQSIADYYNKLYGIKVNVVRNVPLLNTHEEFELTRNELNIGSDKKIIVLQGAGININRGAEEAVEAMQFVNNSCLLIIGSGNVLPKLKQLVTQFSLEQNVVFIDKLPFEKLKAYTKLADIGLSFDKDTNLNYRFSLPNKLFDYVHAGIPVLVSDLVEVKEIVEKYNVGAVLKNHSPLHIAETINKMLDDKAQLMLWKQNTSIAARELNWETEEKKIIHVFEKFK